MFIINFGRNYIIRNYNFACFNPDQSTVVLVTPVQPPPPPPVQSLRYDIIHLVILSRAHDSQIVRAKENLKLSHGGSSYR